MKAKRREKADNRARRARTDNRKALVGVGTGGRLRRAIEPATNPFHLAASEKPTQPVARDTLLLKVARSKDHRQFRRK